MRGVYRINVVAATLAAAAVTLAFYNPNATISTINLRSWASQTGVTVGAQQRVQTNTQVTAFPTLTSATPVKTATGDQASVIVGGTAGAAGTAGTNASAEGAGTKTVTYADTFNILTGWLYTPTPDERDSMSSGVAAGYGLHFPVAAGTTSGWSGGITYQEVG